MTELTDPKIFEPDPAVTYRVFLDGADIVRPIVLKRHEYAGPLVNIPHKLVVHSPDGFEWGYAGSGPAELALNILALFVAPPEAWRLRHTFKNAVIARLEQLKDHTLDPAEVRQWIEEEWAREDALFDEPDPSPETETRSPLEQLRHAFMRVEVVGDGDGWLVKVFTLDPKDMHVGAEWAARVEAYWGVDLDAVAQKILDCST